MPERWHRRIGPRYLQVALLINLSGGYATGVLATAGTALYIDVSLTEFLLLVGASWGLIWLPESLVAAWIAFRSLRPTRAWLSEGREEPGAVEAWNAAADLPPALLRRPLLHLAVLPGIAAWGVFATGLLDLPSYAVFVFWAASLLIYLYWVAVRFLGLESLMRPILVAVGGSLSADTEMQQRVGVSLRWRLLASLVAVTLITGVAVGGFVAGGEEDVRGLGLALLGSAAAALLVSSWLIGLLSTSISNPIYRLRDAAQQVGRGDLSVRVPLTTTDESGELTQTFNRMVGGLEQRERLREAFGVFVDPDLAERVLEEGPDLSGEEIDVSILFMDIRGFTAFAERSEPREVVARLNDLFSGVVPIVLAQEGHANKFIGDGLMAVFGAPNRLTDHADRAVAAGLAIVRLVRDRWGGELRVGVGINSGPVVVGTVGGGGRLDFTVIGDVVNTAARVESATRDTGDDILITDATRGLLAEDQLWEARRPIDLKGKSRSIELFGPSA